MDDEPTDETGNSRLDVEPFEVEHYVGKSELLQLLIDNGVEITKRDSLVVESEFAYQEYPDGMDMIGIRILVSGEHYVPRDRGSDEMEETAD